MLALLTLTPVIPSFAPAKDQAGLSVLVTGAAGRTGKLLYGYLKADPRIGEVRALVYGSGTGSPAERQKAKAALNCSACDASEGIFYGDVTVPSSLTAAFDGMDTVAITTTVGGFGNDTKTREVELVGVENQAAALVAGADASKKHIVLCSAMGTGVSPFGPQPSHGPPSFLKVKGRLFGLSSPSSDPSPIPALSPLSFPHGTMCWMLSPNPSTLTHPTRT